MWRFMVDKARNHNLCEKLENKWENLAGKEDSTFEGIETTEFR